VCGREHFARTTGQQGPCQTHGAVRDAVILCFCCDNPRSAGRPPGNFFTRSAIYARRRGHSCLAGGRVPAVDVGIEGQAVRGRGGGHVGDVDRGRIGQGHRLLGARRRRIGAVVGELYGATEGVGELVYNAKNTFDANGVFAGMALLAAVALVAEACITAVENRLIRWRPNPVTDVTI